MVTCVWLFGSWTGLFKLELYGARGVNVIEIDYEFTLLLSYKHVEARVLDYYDRHMVTRR